MAKWLAARWRFTVKPEAEVKAKADLDFPLHTFLAAFFSRGVRRYQRIR